ncbi:hypothetical protein [Acidisoma silvae]|uniref:hypothetical protein n=1 Tax=Acidisoma silvae TaxID=2802396 RepID=UPI001D0AB1F5|nr:hypothetical protein [Acidisoma silvae]
MTIYRNAILLAFLAVTLLAKSPPAWADFVVKSGSPAPSPAGVAAAPTSMAPIVDPEDLAAKTPHKPTWHWKLAKGFGNNVPLGFACRQIVPSTVRVTYGPGASASSMVSWQGGKGWNEVLREAVKPLGLHLVMTHMAVEIRK